MCSLMLGWILLAGTISVESGIDVKGTVGGTVTFTCSHMFADDNIKYFCKVPCSEKNILIKSDQSPCGRYSLDDLGNGHFIVNIEDLRTSDSGTYRCAVDRFIKDTHTEVRLTVIEAWPSAPPRTSTSTTTSTRMRILSPPLSSIQTVSATNSNSIHPTTSSTHHQPRPPPGILLYAAAGLVGLIIILLISLIVCCRYTKKRKDSEQDISYVYEDVKLHHTEERKPSQALRRVSSVEYGNVVPLENIRHVDNPLYDTREQNMTVYSTVQ